jgi:hypothetical protein
LLVHNIDSILEAVPGAIEDNDLAGRMDDVMPLDEWPRPIEDCGASSTAWDSLEVRRGIADDVAAEGLGWG